MAKHPMSRKAISKLGGTARAKSLSAKQRRKIARDAANARWMKYNDRRTAIASALVYAPTTPTPKEG